MTRLTLTSRSLPIVAGIATLAILGLVSPPARAQISGFGDGTGYSAQTNGSFTPTFSSGTAQLTNNAGSDASSVFYKTPQTITNGFKSSFTSQYLGGAANGIGDGFTFAIQNDPAGASALGANGGSIGFAQNGAGDPVRAGITNGGALYFDLFNGTFTTDPTVQTNSGFVPSGTRPNTTTTGNNIGFSFRNGDAYDITVDYNGVNLTENIQDTNPANSANKYSQTIPVNFTSLLGGSTGYVGFTAGEGGATTKEAISNFSFTPTVTPEPGNLVALAVGGLSLAGLAARRRRAGH